MYQRSCPPIPSPFLLTLPLQARFHLGTLLPLCSSIVFICFPVTTLCTRMTALALLSGQPLAHAVVTLRVRRSARYCAGITLCARSLSPPQLKRISTSAHGPFLARICPRPVLPQHSASSSRRHQHALLHVLHCRFVPPRLSLPALCCTFIQISLLFVINLIRSFPAACSQPLRISQNSGSVYPPGCRIPRPRLLAYPLLATSPH